MSWLTAWRRPSPDERLDTELRDHVERQVADLVAGGMTDADARSYVAVAAFVILVGIAAAGMPALRAARVSPMTALRDD